MMKVEIEIKENNIACKITALEYSHTECDGRIYVTTKRVRKILIENGQPVEYGQPLFEIS